MKNLTIAKRLMLGFGIAIALSVAIGVMGYLGSIRLAANAEGIYRNGVLASQRLAAAQNALWELRFGISQYVAVPKPDARGKIIADSQRLFTAMDENLTHYGKGDLTAEAKQALAELNDIYGQYKDKRPGWFELMEAGKIEEAAEYRSKTIMQSGAGTVKALTKLIETQTSDSKAAAARAETLAGSVKSFMVGILLAVIVTSSIIALWIIRSVTGPLGGEPDVAKAVVERIALGDLTAEIRVNAGDESSLMAATRRMQGSLRKMITELKTNAEGVALASEKLAATSSQVAVATAQQSEAASAMSAAVEEMTVSINHVSDSAHQAHTVTIDTGEQSRGGSRVIQDTVDEMQAISRTVSAAAGTIETMGESSQRISSIVNVIKEVAEQTNLLALNAAIEAARAGEQGRGFAVVADEVRKLAERTAQATTEISTMIGAVQTGAQAAVGTMQQAVTRVESGVDLARKARDSILGISDGAQRVVATVNEISSALKEQSAASNDIAANVETIAQMSEENSAAIREAADTASHLEQLAAATRTVVGNFRV